MGEKSRRGKGRRYIGQGSAGWRSSHTLTRKFFNLSRRVVCEGTNLDEELAYNWCNTRSLQMVAQ